MNIKRVQEKISNPLKTSLYSYLPLPLDVFIFKLIPTIAVGELTTPEASLPHAHARTSITLDKLSHISSAHSVSELCLFLRCTYLTGAEPNFHWQVIGKLCHW